MRLFRLTLAAYGRCQDVGIDIGEGLTVVLGANEAGKSTALSALGDLFWGIPLKTVQVSEFPRAQLRIEAGMELGDTACTVVRRSTGLFSGDSATEILCPWDPDDHLDRDWWRTRLGINHPDLLRGGANVFSGSGDIAEIIFAARQGRSARELLNTISQQLDQLFKAHRGNRSVQLRVAAKEYQQAVEDRDLRLTRADKVVEQREVVDALQRGRRDAKETAAVTSRLLNQAVEDERVIDSVLELRRARHELEAIDEEGERLSPAELTDHGAATAALGDAGKRLVALDAEITERTREIAELSVDDELLADKATIERLQSDAKARIEELDRADGEFGLAAAKETALLRELLGSIGADAADVDAGLAGARVRTDHAATLNDLSDRIEKLDAQRAQARTEHDKALEELAAKGISVEVTEAAAPSEDAIGKLRDDLGAAHTDRATANGLFVKAREGVGELRSGAPTSHAAPEFSRTDVLEARRSRDAQWAEVRRSWVTGELPIPADRVDIAAELDKMLDHSDRVADDEAGERSRVAAQDARIEAHVEGLEAARREEQSAEENLAAAVEAYRRLENQWSAVWTGFGVTDIPSVDSGLAVAGLLLAAHAARARDAAAAGQIAELAESWSAAAEIVGLPATCTTAAWRRRAAVLEGIESVQARRVEAQQREIQARRSWADFSAEVVELLRRHDAADDEMPVTPALVEHGLTELTGRLSAATAAAAERAAHRKEIDKRNAEHKQALLAEQDAANLLSRLAEAHAVATGPELDALAERAVRAALPLAAAADAQRGIKNGLDKGSDPQAVIDRLADADRVMVEQAVDDAREQDCEARSAAEAAGDHYTSERDRLADLEKAAGAADAEAEVAAQQAKVAQLAERWAVLTLQKKLLEDVLDGLGSDETRPLLDHAGRILEQLTGGRWVALRAEEDGDARRLLVIRSDAARLVPAELSEGTADQVFLALRLAAVAELHHERTAAGQPALPLVLDDVLMTFDEVRTIGALRVLEGLAPGLQVIVFTHHRHVAEAARELDRVTVSELPPAAPIVDALSADEVRAQVGEQAVPITAQPESARRGEDQPDPRAVREWAQAQGLSVSPKGRVPREIVEQYLRARP